jgi:uncharacterized protein (TIGR03067 family)
MSPLLLGLTLSLGAPQAKDRPAAEQSLVGEWVLDARTIGGNPVSPFTPAGSLRYTFTGAGECTVSTVPGIPPSKYSFTADGKADPPAFTLVSEGAGTVTAGIYKVEGDTLTLCWDRGPEAARPKKFESAVGSQMVLYVLKRVKAKE